MRDTLYDEFYDPTEDFRKVSGYFCYDLASNLISEAKKVAGDNWFEDENTIKGVLLLLFTWNFAAPVTKKLNFSNVAKVLKETKKDMQFLERYSITDAEEEAWSRIEMVFEQFRQLCGQTGASKALSLLNPRLFVMWDTAIRNRLDKQLIRGIGNGKEARQYVLFLKGVQRIIREYRLLEKLPKNAVVAKKFDEYNYVRIVMAGKGA